MILNAFGVVDFLFIICHGGSLLCIFFDLELGCRILASHMHGHLIRAAWSVRAMHALVTECLHESLKPMNDSMKRGSSDNEGN